MKLIKSIASILLTLSVVGSYAPYALAQTDAITETEITKKEALVDEAEQLLTTVLGRAPRGITRAGFISDVAELAGFGLQSSAEAYFTDLPLNREEASGIQAAVEMGLISDGEIFRPDDIITVNEATKVVVSALGYEEYAKISGGWPSGYVAAADKADIFRNVAINKEQLSEDDAKIMLLNMLNSRMVRLNGNLDFEVGDKTMLAEKYDMYRTAGILTRTEVSDLYETGIEKAQKVIRIGETNYNVAEGSSYTSLLGYSVTAYYNKDGEVILLSKTEKNNTVSFAIEDIEKKDNLLFVYTNLKKKHRYELDASHAVIYNGGLSEKRLESYINTVSGKIVMIDNNDDEEYDVVSVMSPTFVTVKSISKNNKLIYDENSALNTIDMSDDEGNFFINGKDGVMRFIDIQAGETYEIYASEDKKLITATLVTNSITGKVESFSDEEITINGEVFKTTKYFNDYYKKALKAGNEGTFCIASDGRIINSLTYGTGMKYGYLTHVAWADGGLDYQMVVKIYTQDAKSERFTITDKITVDGKRVKVSDLYGRLVTNSIANDQLVAFSADKDNKITALDFAELNQPGELGEKKREGNSLTEYTFAESKFYYKDTVDVMYPYFNVSGTLVFAIPNDLSKKELFRVTGSDFFQDAKSYDGMLKVYNLSESGTAEVVVVRYDDNTRNISKYTNSFVVEKIVREINDDNEELNKVFGWFNNKYVSYYIDENISIVKASGENLGFGDVIRIYTEGDTITTLVCDFDANENVFGPDVTTNAQFNKGNVDIGYQFGKVYSLSGGFIYLGGGDDGLDMEISSLRNFSTNTGNIVIVNMSEKTVRTGTESEIRTYRNSGEEADTVLIKQRNLATTNLIVYVR